MRAEVDTPPGNRPLKLFPAVEGDALSQLGAKGLGVVVGEGHVGNLALGWANVRPPAAAVPDISWDRLTMSVAGRDGPQSIAGGSKRCG